MNISIVLNLKDNIEPNKLAHINLLYSASYFRNLIALKLKPYGLTVEQFNVLRIIAGANSNYLTIKQIAARMIDKCSNVSRIIDKLESKKLLSRMKSPIDKRVSYLFMTAEGKAKIELVSANIQPFLDNLLNLSDEESLLLNKLLDKARILNVK